MTTIIADVLDIWGGLEALARRIRVTRTLALPLLRTLVILAGALWVQLAPTGHRGWKNGWLHR